MNKQQSEKSYKISQIIRNSGKNKFSESFNANITRVDDNKNLHNIRIRRTEIISSHKPKQVKFPFLI